MERPLRIARYWRRWLRSGGWRQPRFCREDDGAHIGDRLSLDIRARVSTVTFTSITSIGGQVLPISQ